MKTRFQQVGPLPPYALLPAGGGWCSQAPCPGPRLHSRLRLHAADGDAWVSAADILN